MPDEKYFVSKGNSYGWYSDYYTVPLSLEHARKLIDDLLGEGLVWFINEEGKPEVKEEGD